MRDKIIIDLNFLAKRANLLNPTKRHIVSVASRIYDPIGIISPITIRFKMLLQDVHCAKIEWDEEINGELLQHWVELISCVDSSEPVITPRCYFKNLESSNNRWKLIGFSDSSIKAYAAVIYLQFDDGKNKRMAFVVSKTCVAPIKHQTIPWATYH
jgi:hypothetical protein